MGGSESLADQEVIEGQPAWRFSVVATEYEGDRPRMRYGLTDETSKLNLNTATREQLLGLFGELELRDVTPEQLVDALTDWMDKDWTSWWREPTPMPRLAPKIRIILGCLSEHNMLLWMRLIKPRLDIHLKNVPRLWARHVV